MSIKKKLKTVSLGLALSLATSFAKDKNIPLNLNQDAQTNKTEIKDSSAQKDNGKEVKAFFSAKQLAHSMNAAGINEEDAKTFLDNYLNNVDANGYISVKGLIDSFQKTGLSKKQSSDIFATLSQSQEKESATKDADLANKNPSKQGYDYGNYNISFAIGSNGQISRMNMRGECPDNLADKKEINEAICRHTNKAVDRMEWELEASVIMDKVLIYNIINEAKEKGENIPNADKYIESFHEEMKKNGLEFGKDGKLHGIEASRHKPLETEKQLQEKFAQKRMQEFKAFKNR